MKRNTLPLIGVVVGTGLIIVSIMSSGPLGRFLDWPSIVITVFGSLCALIISFPLRTLKKIPALLKKLMIMPDDDRRALIDKIVELSKKMRAQGVLSIESDIAELDNEVLVHGLQMVVDGTDRDTIQEILEVELTQTESRHSIGQEVFAKWGEYAPAFGMIGTLIGLISMLGDLDDPSMIGVGMATALLTTLYGSFLANMIFLPIAKNLEMQTANEVKTYEMVIEGVLALQEGQNPRVIEKKLSSFVSQSEHQKEEKVSEAATQPAAGK
jgi:chemotaxis protein MotA